jgi:hypothetical protein
VRALAAVVGKPLHEGVASTSSRNAVKFTV